MTVVIGKKKSRKNKKIVDERAPLLPRQRDEEEEFETVEGFNGASYPGAVFNLSTTVVGAGIMALPATMKVLGLIPGIAMIIFMAFLTQASIEMLLRFSKTGKCMSYGAVMGEAFGKGGRICSQVCVIINNVGVLIVYLIILGDVLSGTSSTSVHHSGVLEGWFGEQWWTSRVFILIVMTLAIFTPLASFKRVDSLRFTSALSVALAVVFVVITAGITILKLFNGSISMPKWIPDLSSMSSIWNLFTVVPVLVTAFICHYNVHTINYELEDESQMPSIVRSSLVLCSSVYIATSVFGFLLFGDATMDDVLANFDTNLGVPYSSILNDAVRVSYAVHLMLVFPIIFFALRLNLDGLLFHNARPLAQDNRRFAGITLGLIAVIFIGANYIPSIWDAFQFTGATAAVCIGFIFPAAIALRDLHGIATKNDKILSIFMIVLAVFSNSVAISNDVSALFEKTSISPRA